MIRLPAPDRAPPRPSIWPPVRMLPSSVIGCVECGARGTTWVETEAGGHLPACAAHERKVKQDAGEHAPDVVQHPKILRLRSLR